MNLESGVSNFQIKNKRAPDQWGIGLHGGQLLLECRIARWQAADLALQGGVVARLQCLDQALQCRHRGP
jgi:hypothetical protein